MKKVNLEKTVIVMGIIIILLQLFCVSLDLRPVSKGVVMMGRLQAVPSNWSEKYGSDLESAQTYNIVLAINAINFQAKIIGELKEKIATLEGGKELTVDPNE